MKRQTKTQKTGPKRHRITNDSGIGLIVTDDAPSPEAMKLLRERGVGPVELAAHVAGEPYRYKHGWIELYHRTTPENADKIIKSKRMISKENTGEIFASTRRTGQADGYGAATVHLRVPEHLAELDDEFPDGEQHYRVKASALKPEHFVGVTK